MSIMTSWWRHEVRPQFHCSDAEVREYVAAEFAKISPYSVPEFTMTGKQLFKAAREKFGKCADDLEFWVQ
jgi:hypothetical protein